MMPQQTIEGFRLSHQQQRVWLLQQVDQSTAYRAQCTVLLEGKLERGKLEAALHAVVQRHEILRTSFHSLPSMVLPLQVVEQGNVPTIEWHDLSALEATALATEVRALAASPEVSESNVPVRFDVLIISQLEHILVVTLSALCADELTLANLIAEISRSYHGDGPAAEELTQYVDYAEWQHDLFESEDTQEERNYWRQLSPTSLLDLKLPLENAAGAARSFAPAMLSTAVSAETFSDIKAFIGARDLTHRQFLLACWQALLWRLTNQPEIAIATACDCRGYESLQRSLGLFTTYIPLRFRLDENSSFSHISSEVCETLRAAGESQDYFCWDQMAVGKQNGSGPSFSTISFDCTPATPVWRGPELSFSVMSQQVCLDRFKLRLSCKLGDDQLVTEFHYDSNLLSNDWIKRLATQFHKLLESILADPQAPIASLDMLSEDERQRLLFEFNQTSSDFGAERCIQQLFAEQAERTPENYALVFEEQELTFRELNARSNQLAHLLQNHGVGPETRVGLYTHRSLETLIGLLGILKAGGAYVPLDRALPGARLARMLADAEVQVVVTQQSLSENLTDFAGHTIYLDTDWPTIAGESTSNPDSRVLPENLACVIYTSGSTGVPKGVGVEHRQLYNYVNAIAERLALPPQSSFATVSTIAADLGNTAIFPALCSGGTLHVISEERALDPEALADYFSRWTIDCLKIVPSHLTALMSSGNHGRVLPRRRLVLGGEASSWSLIDRVKSSSPQAEILNHYGPTETTIGVLTCEIGDHLSRSHAATVPLGRPIANTQIYILDSQLSPVPTGSAGELYIGGKNVSRGYLNAPDITAERFVPHRFSTEPGARLYRTGDLARYLHDGNIEFLGRVDHQVKIHGFRIELGEIEAALAEHPAVAARTVVVREDKPGERRLVAYVVADNNLVVTEAELRSFLETKLPAHMIPPAIVLLDSLPLRPNGKVDQGALPLPEKVKADADRVFIAPRTATEQALAEVWAEVLGLEKVGINDNFFRLGGDSIRGIRILGLAQDRDLHFSMQQLFQHQTIAELARVVSEGAPEKSVVPATEPFSLISIEDRMKLPAGVEDAFPLAKLQEGMLFHSEFSPGSSMYHDITSVHLQCRWNYQHMLTAVERVTAKHPMLRSAFDLANFSEPLQLVYNSVPAPLDVEDVRQLSATEQDQAIDEWLEADSKHRFRWSDAPQLRYKIHVRSDDSFQFTLSRHHSIIDGWSSSSLFTELFQHYLSLLTGVELPPEPPLKLTYRDFVALEREALASTADREFWRNKLSDSTLAIEPDPPGAAEAQEYAVPISPEVSAGLQRLADTAGLPLKDVLLAAHARVMSLISGQSDIVTGLVMHGRPDHVEGERILGLFLNTLPLRLQLGGGTWLDLARDAFAAELEMMPHRRYPLAAIQNDLGRFRLFDTGMIFVNFHVYQGLTPSKSELVPLDIKDIQETNFRFMAEFSLSPFNSQIELNLRLNKAAFTDRQVESFVAYYESTLTRMAADPLERYDAVCLLPEGERQQLITEWNNTRADYPAMLCVHQLIEEQATRSPEATAVISGAERLSYGELNERANQLAHYLNGLGVGPESLVGVCLERSVELMVALLGILKSGAAYLPLDPDYPQERLAYMLADSRAGVLLTQASLGQRFSDLPLTEIFVDGVREELADCATSNVAGSVTPANLAYVIYTSGSTGRPKGIMVSHESVVNFFTGMQRSIGDEPSGTWLAVTSISFDISVLELLGSLTRGFTVVVQPDPARTLNAVSQRRRFAGKKMDFSLFYFASDESEAAEDKYQLLIEGAKFADRNGFDAVWTPERHFHAFGGLYPNPSITSAVVAAITERVKIRAGSVVLPLHSPIRVAEEWSVVDNVSRGRVGISFASGWHANDFVLAPENFQQRKEIMMRDIETVRRLWRSESVVLTGPFGNEVNVKVLPRPVQRELPVWLTAAGNPETFQAAGEIGANLLTHLLGQSIEELSEKIAVYRESWRKAGHAGEGYVTLMLHTFVGEDLDEVREKVRQPFTSYLKSSVGLVQQMKQGMGYDQSAELTDADLELIAATAFKRYFGTSGLLGTPETCLDMVDRLKGIGVDEIGCLIDFGVDHESVISSLTWLNEVRRRSNEPVGADYSLPAQMSRHGVTHLQCTPSMARMLLLDADSRDSLRALTTLMLGGEELPAMLVRELKEFVAGEMHNMYGPTETTIWSASYQIENVDSKVPIGRPITNTEIYILDQFLQPVPVGTPGDLFIGGVGVVRGYLNRPDLTADKFLPDPFSSRPGARLYYTGDRARHLSDGNIEFLGRNDQQVKIRGYRIEPEEIEKVLSSHAQIREAVVVAREFAGDEKQLVAYLVAAEESTPASGEWRRYLKEKLPEYMLPATFVTLETLPLTPNGKIDRRALMELPATLAPQLKDNYVAPRTAAESVVAGIWEQTLGSEQVGVLDNFFELGGNSLSAIRIIVRLREVFQVDLPLRGLFEAPTVEGVVDLTAQVWGTRDIVEQIAETVKEIESLSAEETQRLLLEAKTPNLVESV
jgi:natural product biosynthesis luciferase-like monooxygenase protein/amino acid adenylation domain-containing protein